jgi:hypothetical protein
VLVDWNFKANGQCIGYVQSTGGFYAVLEQLHVLSM